MILFPVITSCPSPIISLGLLEMQRFFIDPIRLSSTMFQQAKCCSRRPPVPKVVEAAPTAVEPTSPMPQQVEGTVVVARVVGPVADPDPICIICHSYERYHDPERAPCADADAPCSGMRRHFSLIDSNTQSLVGHGRLPGLLQHGWGTYVLSF